MYYQSYEDYMRSVLGYPAQSRQNTYETTYEMQYMPDVTYVNPSNYNREMLDLYPEIYQIVNPMVCKICESNTKPLTRELLESMTDEIYSNLESDPKMDTVVNVRVTIPTKLPILTEQPIPIQTVTASPSVTLTQKPVRKSVTDASKREKKQNPALSYYRTEPTGTSDRKKEKEQKPVIRMKTDGNRIRIEISPDIPFQILSFRINGKEYDFYWQGKKLLAELPKKSRNPWKVELIGFVKSGKLYYETMDLPEKQ